MQYQHVSEGGLDYTVRIKHRVGYTTLKIYQTKNMLLKYESYFLPACGSSIEAEDNAQRIADQFLNTNRG